jgi:hypothetical protein
MSRYVISQHQRHDRESGVQHNSMQNLKQLGVVVCSIACMHFVTYPDRNAACCPMGYSPNPCIQNKAGNLM